MRSQLLSAGSCWRKKFKSPFIGAEATVSTLDLLREMTVAQSRGGHRLASPASRLILDLRRQNRYRALNGFKAVKTCRPSRNLQR
jgi:hypothetical protein